MSKNRQWNDGTTLMGMAGIRILREHTDF
jgi:hypothetical protein